jgi:hypothetical protein
MSSYTQRRQKPQLVIERQNDYIAYEDDETSDSQLKWSPSSICSLIYSNRNIDIPGLIALLYMHDIPHSLYRPAMTQVVRALRQIPLHVKPSYHLGKQNKSAKLHIFEFNDIEVVFHYQEGRSRQYPWTLTGRLKNNLYFHLIADSDDSLGLFRNGTIVCHVSDLLEDLVLNTLPPSMRWFMVKNISTKTEYPHKLFIYGVPVGLIVSIHKNLTKLKQVQKFPELIAAHHRIKAACWKIFKYYMAYKYAPKSTKVIEMMCSWDQ